MIAIGDVLFNYCFVLFFGATMLLFIAMIGAIILTLDNNNKSKSIYKVRLKSKNIN